MDIMHDTTPKKVPAKHAKDEEMVHEWRHRTMVEDQQKELDRWREVKDQQKELDRWREVKETAAKEKWDKYWTAWTTQKSLDEEKEKGKRKRYDTKEEAGAAAGDDKDRDPDYLQSKEGSSQDLLYLSSKLSLRELTRKEKNKK